MVTKIKKRRRRRRSVPLKALEARGLDILKAKEPIIDAGPNPYLVPSMSAESYRDVRHLAGGLVVRLRIPYGWPHALQAHMRQGARFC